MPRLTRSTRLLAAGAALACAALTAPANAASTSHLDPVAHPEPSYALTARQAFGLAETSAATKGSTPYVWASLARTSAALNGWNDPTTLKYINKTIATQHSWSGGWGIDRIPFDAFSDGSMNAWNTTYTVTTTDHVGPLLVMGYKKGVVPRTVLARAVDSVLATPSATMATGGKCISYSMAVVDRVTATNGKCVSNVNASAAWFLKSAADAGVVKPGQRELADALMRHDSASRLPNGLWPYIYGQSTRQDLDHNALNVEAHLAYTLADGAPALRSHLATPFGTDPMDKVAVLRLVPYDRTKCSVGRDYARQTLDAIPSWESRYAANAKYTTTIRYAQVALYASRDANACGTN